jgi:fatty-acyl-CoA synthase
VSLAARLGAHVAARPGAPALVFEGRSWTYAEFAAEVSWQAERLRGAGLRRGQALGWLGFNSVAMLAAFFACARSGIVFVPLNWRLAGPELAALARHAGLAFCHADPGFEAPACPGGESPDGADDLLLVYTSGTTGTPKGAVHTQAAMLANLDAAIDAQALDVRTRCLAVLPMFHVGGLCIQTLPTLAAGGVVKLHPRFDAGAWLGDAQDWQPTTSLLVPATMKAVIDHARWPATDLHSLAFINTGSSIVPRPLIDAFHARGVPVCQVYGATETGPVTLVLRPEEALAHPGSAGRPARGVDVRLQDDELQVCAPNLARGYHRESAAAAFAAGWFRTGDLAQVDADGYFTIVGRLSDRIISGGENIDPAEIEAVAMADPAVAEAAVVGVADPRWGEVAVLALVLRPGALLDAARLQTAFEARLARFKHPRRSVVVDALPRTALGKVRKSELAQRLA